MAAFASPRCDDGRGAKDHERIVSAVEANHNGKWKWETSQKEQLHCCPSAAAITCQAVDGSRFKARRWIPDWVAEPLSLSTGRRFGSTQFLSVTPWSGLILDGPSQQPHCAPSDIAGLAIIRRPSLAEVPIVSSATSASQPARSTVVVHGIGFVPQLVLPARGLEAQGSIFSLHHPFTIHSPRQCPGRTEPGRAASHAPLHPIGAP